MERVSSTGARSYGGVSAAERKLERRRRLTDAALDVMAADEWRGATVAQICAGAGLNKRYFYEGFADLDELASAVVDDIADDVREATLAAFAAEALFEVVALVGFDGTNEPLADVTGRAPLLTGACEVRRCARGGPVEQCRTPRAFPRTRLAHGTPTWAGSRPGPQLVRAAALASCLNRRTSSRVSWSTTSATVRSGASQCAP